MIGEEPGIETKPETEDISEENPSAISDTDSTEIDPTLDPQANLPSDEEINEDPYDDELWKNKYYDLLKDI